MRGSQVETPCPVPSSLPNFLTTHDDETTTTIDFTTEFRSSLRNVKPRRRQRQSFQFEIHEDQHEGKEEHRDVRAGLSQPPKRLHVARASCEMDRSDGHQSQQQPQPSGAVVHPAPGLGRMGSRLSHAPKRLTAQRLPVLPEDAVKGPPLKSPPPPRTTTTTPHLRPARRGTIYIPNEDTTMPSMYMGIFSPIKDLDINVGVRGQPEHGMEMTGLAAQMVMKRSGNKSTIRAAPRRCSLQPILGPLQGTSQVQDRHGQGTGKENVPPGAQETDKLQLGTSEPKSNRSRVTSPRNQLPTTNRRKDTSAPTVSSSLRCESSKSLAAKQPPTKPSWNSGPRARHDGPIHVVKKPERPAPPPHQPSPSPLPPPNPTLPALKVPTRMVAPVIRPLPALQNHSILQEDIVNPAMYEENWLHHQEIAITQLVNNLFSVNTVDGDDDGQRKRRSAWLEAYQSPAMLLMHRRLQAAIAYGALSIPQHTIDQSTRLYDDLGLRRCFTDLWLSTYDLEALEPALEVVMGRSCRSKRVRESSPSSKSCKSEIRRFIESFLMRNDDAQPELGTKSRAAWSCQRTILRSLMLVKLLDVCRSEPSIHFPKCLFQTSSPFKSSVSVVRALMQMLNPSAGDAVRALNHIEYSVDHAQHPLEEFSYSIDNLAVDLRDGIRLTRLVELVLYPSATQQKTKEADGGTTTILMPEGEMLECTNGENWPISQHLKTTCPSRAVRLWNVELALSALKAVRGVQPLIEDITAADVVDGFREKTIRLLWALVGKWGLSGLVNWQDLRWEIGRLERKSNTTETGDFSDVAENEDEYSFETCKTLLRRWARAVALNHGVQIRNFTTSFADGRAFEAIVNEYEPHFWTEGMRPNNNNNNNKKASLRDRLEQLGCSGQFAQLFAGLEQTHIFDRDFVLAAIAFLCSRLLAPSRPSRAATVIQHAWRRHWIVVEMWRKREKRRVAAACADLVRCKRKERGEGQRVNKNDNDNNDRSEEKEEEEEVVAACISDEQQAVTDRITSPSSLGEADIWLTL